MSSSSSAILALAPPTETVYKFRMTAWAWVLLYQCLVMALPILKLLHLAAVGDWAWSWVTLPIWAPSALLAIVLSAEQLTRLGKSDTGSRLPILIAESSVVG